MPPCVFCKIVNKEIPAASLYEDGELIVIKDLRPKAPVHLLIICKKHIDSVNRLEPTDRGVLANMFFAAKSQAEIAGVADSGYKLVFNVGRDGGQTIAHLHLHLLGGRQLEE